MSETDFKNELAKFRRVPLAHLPTPLEELALLTHLLGGPDILIKRDDCTGLAMGGNKARKLEFLIADALDRGFDTIVTGGAIQSNHCRQTIAAATKNGLKCILVLTPSWMQGQNGNLLLDKILGAEIVLTNEGQPWEDKYAEIEPDILAQGKKPYVIPTGGSNALGSLGYVEMINELLSQCEQINRQVNYIVSASGSGGTQAGMVAGNKLNGSPLKVIGISVGRKKEDSVARISSVARDVGTLLNQPITLNEHDVEVLDAYKGGGYGVPTEEGLDEIERVARLEGIILDPIYTAKAMAALVDLVKNGRFSNSDTVVFLHTGGTPAIFPYGYQRWISKS